MIMKCNSRKEKHGSSPYFFNHLVGWRCYPGGIRFGKLLEDMEKSETVYTYTENIYICDRIDSPFIFGIIKPRIYLPSRMNEEQKESVIAHERAHLKRLDHFWKPLGFGLLSVYWFNPLCWLAYILFCRDIELACDEKVIKDMDAKQKKIYSKVLLSLVNQKNMYWRVRLLLVK